MKKIINKPESLVLEMCNGLIAAHPELELLPKYKVIKKRKINDAKVILISGGGSGHEPAHAGYIGRGMLDAAVLGDMFASPSQIQVYQAIKATESKKGTLLIIKNYSGDIMNFKNAAHMASEDGIDIEYIRVDDDIAVEDSLYTVGRRGVAGVVLVHKIAGAAAEEGRDLLQVKAVAEKAASQVRTIGLALTSCTVPASGTPTFKLEDDEMEYGVGIHGEPGIRREKIVSADELAERMVAALLKDLGIDDQQAEKVAVMVNGFGATPLHELYLYHYAVVKELAKRNIHIVRTFVGDYMTSIDMAGISLSLMKLDDELDELLSRECHTPAFRVDGPVPPVELPASIENETEQSVSFQAITSEQHAIIRNNKLTLDNVIYLVDKMSEMIIENEVYFCELDSHAGDGDFGMSLAKGFKQLKREWSSIVEQEGLNIGSFLDACSLVLMEHCGGASGPIWGTGFRAAGKEAGNRMELKTGEFAVLLQASVDGIQDIGERSFGRGAVVGDKTLIDALVPFANSWSEGAAAGNEIKIVFEQAAQAAVQGADETKQMVARMGRAGNVGDRSLGHPDAGAFALGMLLTSLSRMMKAE